MPHIMEIVCNDAAFEYNSITVWHTPVRCTYAHSTWRTSSSSINDISPTGGAGSQHLRGNSCSTLLYIATSRHTKCHDINYYMWSVLFTTQHFTLLSFTVKPPALSPGLGVTTVVRLPRIWKVLLLCPFYFHFLFVKQGIDRRDLLGSFFGG